MQVVDWIAIGVLVLTLALGLLLGFGKILKMFTGGIFGIIISLVVTYFCLGIVASWGFVQDLMAKLLTAMENANNSIVDFLITIGIEKIILAVGLFIIVQVLRIIIVNVIKSIVEVNNPVIKVINRMLGVVLLLAIMCMIALLVFHVIALVGGASAENFQLKLSGSVFKLDWVYENNPLQYIIEKVIPA